MPETMTEKAPVIPDGKTEVSCLLEMMVSTSKWKAWEGNCWHFSQIGLGGKKIYIAFKENTVKFNILLLLAYILLHCLFFSITEGKQYITFQFFCKFSS